MPSPVVSVAAREEEEVGEEEDDDDQVQTVLKDVDRRAANLQAVQAHLPIPEVSKADAGHKAKHLNRVYADQNNVISRPVDIIWVGTE